MIKNKIKHSFVRAIALICSVVASAVAAFILMMAPAIAHHASGGEAPKSLLEGFVTGLAHPVIGLDHLAFVVAIGLVAAVLGRGVGVLAVFLLAALVGTGLHLASVNLPAPELVISASVLLFGGLVATRRPLNCLAVGALSAVAGIFHGYAYGEAVVGAQSSSVMAYLIGFTLIQGAIAGLAYLASRRALAGDRAQSHTSGTTAVKQAGFAICGAGAVFLGSLLI